MSILLAQASQDEKQKYSGGKAGDQTGKETNIVNWYSNPWSMVLRYKDAAVAKRAAEIATKLVNSNLVGYDQTIKATDGRNTLYKTLEKYSWDVDAYIKSKTKTEVDCSSFVYTCYACLIPEIRSDKNCPNTSALKTRLTAHGFTTLVDTKYLTSGSNLQAGDIVNQPGSHAAMVVQVDSPKAAPSASYETAHHKDAKLSGKYKVIAAVLNVRVGAGTNKAILTTIIENTVVKCYGYYNLDKEGNKWYCIQFNKEGQVITGYASSKYLIKV